MLPYVMAILAGASISIGMVTDRRLRFQERVRVQCPALEPGAWMRRRYIETGVVSALTLIGSAIYFLVTNNFADWAMPVGVLAFGTSYYMARRLDEHIVTAYGHSDFTSRRAVDDWYTRRVKSKTEEQLARWIWYTPLLQLVIVGGGVSVATTVRYDLLTTATWMVLVITLFFWRIKIRRGIAREILNERSRSTTEQPTATSADTKPLTTNTARQEVKRRGRQSQKRRKR